MPSGPQGPPGLPRNETKMTFREQLRQTAAEAEAPVPERISGARDNDSDAARALQWILEKMPLIRLQCLTAAQRGKYQVRIDWPKSGWEEVNFRRPTLKSIIYNHGFELEAMQIAVKDELGLELKLVEEYVGLTPSMGAKIPMLVVCWGD